jgi:hypothetical protein
LDVIVVHDSKVIDGFGTIRLRSAKLLATGKVRATLVIDSGDPKALEIVQAAVVGLTQVTAPKIDRTDNTLTATMMVGAIGASDVFDMHHPFMWRTLLPAVERKVSNTGRTRVRANGMRLF